MLWPHQATAVEALKAHDRYALWWQPGCGKTAPLAIAGMDFGPQLWLTPASLRSQAAKEVSRFRADDKPIFVVSTGKVAIPATAQVVVCSYELARTMTVWKQLFARSWGSLVLDEAHRLASPSAAITKAVYGARPTSPGALFRRAKKVWISTGTPITNYPDGVYTHFSRLWPALATKTLAEWRDQYCQMRHNFGLQVVGGKNLDELARLLAAAGSSLKLTDAKDMPPLLIDRLALNSGGLDLRDIDPAIRAELEAVLQQPDADDAWAQLLNLAPALATLRARIALAKAGAVAAIAEEELAGGLDRVIVFGCHVQALEHARACLDRHGARLIIGATPTKERDEAIAAFERGECRALVGNVLSIGTGLNLQCCARAIFLDAAWSPAQNEQAIHRLFRAGQNRPVRVSFSFLEESVDERVSQVLSRKVRISKAIEGART